MKFKDYLSEEFEQKDLKASAEKWLKQKFGDEYEFVHKPNLTDGDKTYHCSIDGKQFSISGRKYDTDGDGSPDTVGYKIINSEEEIEKPESAF